MAAYNAFAAEVTAGMPKYGGDLFEGGCGCAGKFLGGAELAENAADYGLTANAAVHRELHGRAEAAMDKLFKLGAGELAHGKYHARVAKIRGLKLAGSDVQRKVANAIVETYSGAYEKSFKNLGQVRDFLKELAIGARAESAGVKNAIGRVVNNLNTASEKLNDWLGKLESAIGVAELGSGQAEIKTYLAASRETVKFISHQAATFKSLFEGIIEPTGKSIDDLIASTAVFDDLDKDLGSKEYAEQIREILQFGASFADKTKLFEEALKKLGSTMEAARGMSLGKLEETVTDAVRGKKNLDEMRTLLKAFEFVRKNFSLAKEIRGRGQVPAFYEGGDGVVPAFYEGGETVPNFFTGGAEEVAAYFGAATVPAFYAGGATVPAFYEGGVTEFAPQNSKTKIERELEVKKKLRAVILHAFSKRLFEELEKAVQALHVISVKIGTEIPLSDNLDAFRASLVRLGHVSQTDTPRLYALCGYFNDSTSKSIKDDFVAQLKTIIGYIDTLVEMNDYRASAQYFKSLQENLRAVIGVVDKFSDEVKEKFGAHDVKEGGADDDMEFKKSDFQPRYKSPKTFMGAVTKFDYYYKSAQIKRNLTVAGKDMETFSKEYPELVAKSIATILQEELKKYETLCKQLEILKGYKPDGINWTDAVFDAYSIKGTKADDDAKWQTMLGDARKMLDQAWETKKKFWRTVEALDMYMKAFTDGIVNNPQDIRDIKSMLDDIPVVSDVYSKKSGEHLTKIFDSFPAEVNYGVNAGAAVDPAAPAVTRINVDDKNVGATGHYFSQASSWLVDHSGKLPGNHLLCQLPAGVKESKKAAADMFRNVYYLKNLISVFVHIGSKFGGSELRSKITLSPTHIYDNLVNYLQNSAYSIGFGTAGATEDGMKDETDGGIYYNSNTYAIAAKAAGAKAGGAAGAAGGVAGAAVGAANISKQYTYDTATENVFGALRNGMEMFDWKTADGKINNTGNKPLFAFQKIFGTWMRTEGFEAFEGFSFKFEDEYFQLIMKSICAKIFTVIGTYDVFDRPLEYNGLSAVRMILGGSDEAPKVDDAAVELYLRLPLLLEFYKKIFGYDKDENYDTTDYPHKNAANGLKISMVPDVDGVFAGLIKIIFRDSRFVKTRAYSDDTVAAIVREVNSIYQKMAQKYPAGEVVHKTVMELVNEINRRYGVLSKKERDDYELDLNRGNAYKDWPKEYKFPGDTRGQLRPMEDDDSREYAILPGEENEADAQAVSRAEIMLDSSLPGNISAVKSRNHFKIMAGHKEILYRFRCLVESHFNGTNESFSFAGAIKAARTKLKSVSSDQERFSIVCGLVRGKDVTTARDSLAWLLFHETVVLGLNTLSAIHSILARFKQVVLATDVERILKHLAKAPAAGLATRANIIDDLQNSYFKEICAVKHGLFGEILADHPGAIGGNGVLVANPHGVLQLLAGQPNINVIIDPKTDAQIAANRLLFKSDKIMRILVESLFAFGEDLQGLASVKFEQNMVNISTKGLKTLVGDLFESVNYFIDVLRPHIPIDTLDKYLEKETPGSYWWLHEQLMEKIIIGRDQIIGADETKSKEYISLDRLSERINSTWAWLMRDVNSKIMVADGGNPNYDHSISPAGTIPVAPKYGDVFAELVYYGAKDQLKDKDGNTSRTAVSCVDFLNDPYEALHFSGQQGAKVIDTRFVARFKELYSFDEQITPNKSALFGFNQLVAKYIKQFYDTSVQKIYQGLVLPFAGNAFNQAVLDFKFTYPDVVPAVIAKGSLGESAAASPLYNLIGKMPPSAYAIKDFVKNVLSKLWEVDSDALSKANLERAAAVAVGLDQATNIAYVLDDARVGLGPPIVNGFGMNSIDEQTDITIADYRYILMAQAMLDKAAYDQLLSVPAITANLADVNLTANVAGVILPAAEVRSLLNRYGIVHNTNPGGGAIGANHFDIAVGGQNNDGVARLASVAAAYKYLRDTGVAGGANIGGANYAWFFPTVTPIYGAVALAATPLGIMADYIFKTTTSANRAASGLVSRIIKTIPDGLTMNQRTVGEVIEQAAHGVAYLAGNLHSIYDTNQAAFEGADPAAGRGGAATTNANALRILKKTKEAVAAIYKEVSSALLSPARSFIPAHSGMPRHSAKYDEMITMSTVGEVVSPPIGATGTLIMARASEKPGMLDKDSLKAAGVDYRALATPGNYDDGIFHDRADPDSEHVLFTSLSDIFRNLLTSRTLSTQAYVYLQDNVADITFHMKEKLRANLPAFKALFSAMINRCEFLRHISREGAIKLERAQSSLNSKHNPWPFILHDPVADDKTNRLRQHGILDAIIRGCTALISSCDKVLMEIGDEPKFMELYQNSIKDYRARNGMEPFAPLSTVGKIFSNIRSASSGSEEDYSVFLPTHALGSNSSKFIYGTRALLHKFDAPAMAQAPGFASTMDYATLSVAGVEKRKIETFFGAFVRAARYINETRHFKNILNAGVKLEAAFNAESSFCSSDLIITDSGVNGATGFLAGAAKDVTNKWDMSICAPSAQNITVTTSVGGTARVLFNHADIDLLARPIYQTKNTLGDVIQLTENTAREEQIKKVVEYIAKTLTENTTDLEVLNIIDLNIVPINVHALMREIPLANLYNYSYTCDRMIIELFYGLKNKNAQKLIEQLCNASATANPATNGIAELTSAKDLLTALLLNPYRKISADEGDLVHQMFVGATAIDGLGRPKFISDQIYNSAIFGEMYGATGYSEVGPSADRGDAMYGLNRGSIKAIATAYVGQLTQGIHGNGQLNHGSADLDGYVSKVIDTVLRNPMISASDLRKAVPAVAGVGKTAGAAAVIGAEGNKRAMTMLCIYIRIVTYFLMEISNALEQRVAAAKIASLINTMNLSLAVFTLRMSQVTAADATNLAGKKSYARKVSKAQWDASFAAIKGAAPVALYSADELPDHEFTARPRASGHDVDPRTTERMYRLIEDASAYDGALAGIAPVIDMFKDFIPNEMKKASLVLNAPNNALRSGTATSLHYLESDSDNDIYPDRWKGANSRLRPDNANVVSASQIKTVSVDATVAPILAELSRLRLDSRLIRNLIFIVNLYRAVRVKLQRDLTYDREVIQSSAAITKDSITEFFGNQLLGTEESDWIEQRRRRYNY